MTLNTAPETVLMPLPSALRRLHNVRIRVPAEAGFALGYAVRRSIQFVERYRLHAEGSGLWHIDLLQAGVRCYFVREVFPIVGVSYLDWPNTEAGRRSEQVLTHDVAFHPGFLNHEATRRERGANLGALLYEIRLGPRCIATGL